MISFDVGNDKFNFRVCAIIIDSSGRRFLTNTRSSIDFFVLPGGRIEMGENSQESLKREIEEELGVQIDIIGIKATTENFFSFDNKNYHELQYVYYAKLKESDRELEENENEFYGVEKKDLFKWQSIDDIDKLNYKPKHLKAVIKEVFDGDFSIKHIIHKGNG